ncbi:MAG: hypothetical protein JST80_13285 [Bdellovibrionales bacterium]|nr:hypothetical protein [Bdellovibrionales bacterium]
MFDPSKMSPQAISEMTELMRTLSPQQMMKLQTLMHNSMAGFNIQKDMAEFEQGLPADFRAKMARIMYLANGVDLPAQPNSTAGSVVAPTPTLNESAPAPTTETEARLVILRSVSQGLMSPDEAFKVLFP